MLRHLGFAFMSTKSNNFVKSLIILLLGPLGQQRREM